MMTKFELHGKELERANAFEKKHLACAKKHPTTIGGNIEYRFTPTSIGNAVSIKCFLCGEEENITDYDLW